MNHIFSQVIPFFFLFSSSCFVFTFSFFLLSNVVIGYLEVAVSSEIPVSFKHWDRMANLPDIFFFFCSSDLEIIYFSYLSCSGDWELDCLSLRRGYFTSFAWVCRLKFKQGEGRMGGGGGVWTGAMGVGGNNAREQCCGAGELCHLRA